MTIQKIIARLAETAADAYEESAADTNLKNLLGAFKLAGYPAHRGTSSSNTVEYTIPKLSDLDERAGDVIERVVKKAGWFAAHNNEFPDADGVYYAYANVSKVANSAAYIDPSVDLATLTFIPVERH